MIWGILAYDFEVVGRNSPKRTTSRDSVILNSLLQQLLARNTRGQGRGSLRGEKWGEDSLCPGFSQYRTRVGARQQILRPQTLTHDVKPESALCHRNAP